MKNEEQTTTNLLVATAIASAISVLPILEISTPLISLFYKGKGAKLPKIFISHSSKDKEIVQDFMDLLNVIGIKNELIFCSSFSDTSIILGNDSLDTIKKEINEASLVFFIISENFYNSTICLCELGAAWGLSKYSIPIIIPPFQFRDIKGVITSTQAMKINDKGGLNGLKEILEKLSNNTQLSQTNWEIKRDNAITLINKKIKKRNNKTIP